MEKERERKRDKAENPSLVGRPAGWKKEVEEESRGQGVPVREGGRPGGWWPRRRPRPRPLGTRENPYSLVRELRELQQERGEGRAGEGAAL